MRGSRGLPFGCLPLWEREGVTLIVVEMKITNRLRENEIERK